MRNRREKYADNLPDPVVLFFLPSLVFMTAINS